MKTTTVYRGPGYPVEPKKEVQRNTIRPEYVALFKTPVNLESPTWLMSRLQADKFRQDLVKQYLRFYGTEKFRQDLVKQYLRFYGTEVKLT